MSKKKALPLLEGVRIEGVAAEGKAVARVGGMVVFAPFCVPGDVVDLQVRRKKHSFMEAEVARFVEKSPVRETPRCRHFGVCGGCKWQNLPYTEQLRYKQQQVEDQLKRIGRIEIPPISPILGSPKTYEYRNKLEFGCCNKRWLTREEVASGRPFDTMDAVGFHITGAFDKIYPIEECCLMDSFHNSVRNEIRDHAISTGMTFFDLRRQCGLLRDIVMRNSNTGEWMLLVQFHYDGDGDEVRAMALLGHIARKFPEITSLMYVNNQKCNDTFGDLDIKTYSGNGYIFEQMGDLRFKVGPKSFYQTNTEQAHNLYRVAREFAGLTGHELVYDLYTGTGTIANFVARQAREVIGIEYVADAIADARLNSGLNGIGNTRFYAGDMKDVLTDEFISRQGRPDVVITDPPRAGMHGDVIDVILRANPARIVYVSCNPATQARDIQLLDSAYKATRIQPVDMFPHTPHVENVVLMERR